MDSFSGIGARCAHIVISVIASLTVAALMPFIAGCIHMPQTTALDASLPRTVINGYPFHTEVYGGENLPVVIVLHGGPGGDFTYLRPLKALADEYRVIFYDQRGTGLSARESTDRHTFDLFVEDLDALVDYYGNGRPVRLIGHSFGGMLVTVYISRHGEKVSHAAVAEPGILTPEAHTAFLARWNGSMTLWSKAKAVPYFIAALFVRREDGHETKDYIMTKMLGSGNNPLYQCEGSAAPAESAFRRAGSASLESMLPYMNGEKPWHFNLTAGVERYSGKLLMLSGECSFIGYDFQERYHRASLPAAARHVLMKKTGHDMVSERPEETVALLREFLRD